MKVKIDCQYSELDQKNYCYIQCGYCNEEIISDEWQFCFMCGKKIELTDEAIMLFEGN